MQRYKLFHLLLIMVIGIMITSVLSIAWYSSKMYEEFYIEEKRIELRSAARLISSHIGDSNLIKNLPLLTEFCDNTGQSLEMRITVILSNGLVIYDNKKSPELMENHINRAAISKALKGEEGQDVHFSRTINKRMMYLATPVIQNNQIIGVVRTSLPLSGLKKNLNSFYGEIAMASLIIVFIGIIGAYIFSRLICRPINDLREGAKSYAKGELKKRIGTSSIEEISLAIDTMHAMAGELSTRITAIERERKEKETILGSMSEGVMALDSQERLLYLNDACCQLFGIRQDTVLGRMLHEVIRAPEILEIASIRLRKKRELVEEQIVVHSPTEKNIQLHAVPLWEDNGDYGGAVLVFNDITVISRLERTRRDFVANVSHELRTPITSILGFVETLQEGAKDDRAKAERFLNIIRSQTERMVSIIDDLLLLSRLDSENGQQEIDFQPQSLDTLVFYAIDACSTEASLKNIRIESDCDDKIIVNANPHLLEQALINLLSNAIRYSDNESTIKVRVCQENNEAAASISDTGCGIAEKDLPRLFERFYRVDKARSRKAGGTGLGLSIVKHIAMVHSGRVEVKSQLGNGSTFTLYLPFIK